MARTGRLASMPERLINTGFQAGVSETQELPAVSMA
jgi:hypothetical protein